MTLKHFLSITATILFLACGSQKIVGDNLKNNNNSKKEIVQALESRNVEFDWFIAKAKVKVESPDENGSGLAYIRVKKDSVIWLVFKKNSVEASRLLIRQDSFFVIFRLENTYRKGAIEALEKEFKVDFTFADAQEMLVGNSILPDTADLKIENEEEHIRVKGKDVDIILNYLLRKSDLSLASAQYTDAEGREVLSTYDKYKSIPGKGRIPYLRTYTMPLENNEKVFFRLDYSDIKFDEAGSVRFSIPDHYEEIY